MDARAFFVVILHSFLEGLSAGQAKAHLDIVYDEKAPSYTMIKKWYAAFRRGERSLSDAARAGRPKAAADEEHVEKVREKIIGDRRVTVRAMAKDLRISIGTVSTIVNRNLGARKLKKKRVPRELSKDQKRRRVEVSKQNLNLLRRNPRDFWRRLLTVDETWIHHFTPDSREATREWVFPG